MSSVRRGDLVVAQMWQGRVKSWRRCGRERVPSQCRGEMGVSPVVAQMREEKSPVPVLMWAGKSPVVAKISDRGEGCGWAESYAQMRMRISAAQSNAVASRQGRAREGGAEPS